MYELKTINHSYDDAPWLGNGGVFSSFLDAVKQVEALKRVAETQLTHSVSFNLLKGIIVVYRDHYSV